MKKIICLIALAIAFVGMPCFAAPGGHHGGGHGGHHGGGMRGPGGHHHGGHMPPPPPRRHGYGRYHRPYHGGGCLTWVLGVIVMIAAILGFLF